MIPEGIQAECVSDWLDKVFNDLSDDETAGKALATLQVFFPSIAVTALDLCDSGKVERMIGRKWGLSIDVVHGHYTAQGFVSFYSRDGVCTCRDFAATAIPDPLSAPMMDESSNDYPFAFGSGRGTGPFADDGPVSSGGVLPFCAHILAVRIADATGRLPLSHVDDARVVDLLQHAGL